MRGQSFGTAVSGGQQEATEETHRDINIEAVCHMWQGCILYRKICATRSRWGQLKVAAADWE